MKNVLKTSVLVLGTFIVTGFSFANENTEKPNQKSSFFKEANCNQLYLDLYEAYKGQYSEERAHAEAREEYDECVDEGGTGTIIFIEGPLSGE